MNTDTMCSNKPLYAYVYISIRRKVAFLLYLRRQRQQGYLHDIFRIECYSKAEVAWYRQMCSRMLHWLVLLQVDYIELMNDGYIENIDGGDNLDATLNTFSVREGIDGKFFGEIKIREAHTDKEF